MKNKKAQETESVESIVSGLRDDFISQSPEPEKLETPKKGKELPSRQGRTRLLNMLTVLVILAGVTAAAYMLTQSNDSETAVTAANDVVIDDDLPVEEIPADIDPTLPIPSTTAVPPAETAVSIPNQLIEPLPTEQTLTLPEETPLPTPPISSTP